MFLKGARSVPWCETEYKGFQRHILTAMHQFGALTVVVIQAGANMRYRSIRRYTVWSHGH